MWTLGYKALSFDCSLQIVVFRVWRHPVDREALPGLPFPLLTGRRLSPAPLSTSLTSLSGSWSGGQGSIFRCLVGGGGGRFNAGCWSWQSLAGIGKCDKILQEPSD